MTHMTHTEVISKSSEVFLALHGHDYDAPAALGLDLTL